MAIVEQQYIKGINDGVYDHPEITRILRATTWCTKEGFQTGFIS